MREFAVSLLILLFITGLLMLFAYAGAMTWSTATAYALLAGFFMVLFGNQLVHAMLDEQTDKRPKS